MVKEVLHPLEMKDSTFEPYRPPFQPRMAMGYYENGTPVGWRVTGGLAAAWLHTTPSDLARFLAAIRRAYRRSRESTDSATPARSVISPRTARLMLTPTGEAAERDNAYTSLGIFIRDTPRGRLVFHEGSNRGYRCGMWIFLDGGDGLVVMTNSNSGRPLCRAAFEAVFPRSGGEQ